MRSFRLFILVAILLGFGLYRSNSSEATHSATTINVTGKTNQVTGGDQCSPDGETDAGNASDCEGSITSYNRTVPEVAPEMVLQGGTIVVNGSCTLVDAIIAANTDAPSGSCPAGNGDDTIFLDVDETISTGYDPVGDPDNGLPPITSVITIVGRNANIVGSVGTDYRLFFVNASGTLVLNNLAIFGGVIDNAGGTAQGGAIFNNGSLTVIASLILSNRVTGEIAQGGALFSNGSFLSINQTTFSSNMAISVGTGFAQGGAIHNETANASLIGVNFNNNTASEVNNLAADGGALSSTALITEISNGTYTENSAVSGGAIYNGGGITEIVSSTFDLNAATDGGAIYDAATTAQLLEVTFTSNSATDQGGAYYHGTGGPTTIDRARFVSNSAATQGGGVYHSGNTLSIVDSEFAENSSAAGGGMFATNPYAVTNSTFSENHATSGPGGGIRGSGTATITHVTFLKNTSTNAGEAVNITGSIVGSILASSGGVADCAGTLSGTNNLGASGDTSCNTITGGSTIAVGSQIDDMLNFNSGPTRTHQLIPTVGTHPAIDQNPSCGLSTDQRGATRDANCDIGAYEFGALPPPPTPTNTTIPPTDTPIPPTDTPIPPTDTPDPSTLVASAQCVGDDLVVSISSGEGPFDIDGTGTGLPLNDVALGDHTLTGPGTWTGVSVMEQFGDNETVALGDFDCPVPPTDTPVPPTDTPIPPTDTPETPTDTPIPPTDTDTPIPTGALTATVSCNLSTLVISITDGDAPFLVTASNSAVGVPATFNSTGTFNIAGPERWDDLTITEQSGDTQSINFGLFRCRPQGVVTPLTPAHRSRFTNPFPVFTWTSAQSANRYRLFIFDDADAAQRTFDLRQNVDAPQTFYRFTNPFPVGRFFWRVRYRVNSVWSLWSIRFTFFIDQPGSIMAASEFTTIEASNPAVLRSGTWVERTTNSASGGSYLYSNGTVSDALTIDIIGNEVAILYPMHPSLGTLTIEVDGRPYELVAQTGPESFAQMVTLSGLGEGVHRIRVTSSDGVVAVDAFRVLGLASPSVPIVTTPAPTVMPVPTVQPPNERELTPTAQPPTPPNEPPPTVATPPNSR